MSVQIAGVAWYAEENYDRLRKLFKDGAKLPETYAEWLERAEQAIKQIEGGGAVKALKVNIDPDEFPAWCRANGHDVDSRGRIAFANRKAYEAATRPDADTDSVN